MRILICYPGHVISTVDVARGWESALRKLGHDVIQFAYEWHVPFYGAVLDAWSEWNPDFKFRLQDALMLSSQDLVCKVIDLMPIDLCLIVCGLLVHERGYEQLRKIGVPTCVMFTESPYNDHLLEYILPRVDAMFVNDRNSVETLRAQNRNVFYMPHSYDPERHHPAQPADAELVLGGPNGYRHQVFFMGALYEERKALFQALAEIELGQEIELDIYTTSMDRRGRVTGGMQNDELVRHYWGSDIVLSPNRTTKDYFEQTQIEEPAYSLGPRVYEVAACGAFQLTDPSRPELGEVFGETIPVYHNAEELAEQIRYFTARAVEREARAEWARERVAPCTFENRAREIFLPKVEEVFGG